ncbi:MAG: hypothetical protein DKT66_18155 [Candidatus Melainabacteria bacterium]|nr:MAG: hypothetical protein DKT66_18155 [Candidatus Melainabacteria bacterium]
MIILDYKNIDLKTCELDCDEEIWSDAIYFNAFSGTQIFIANDADFTLYVPILGFARQLKAIAIDLKEKQISGSLVDPKFMWTWKLEFVDKSDVVEITAVKWRDPSIKGVSTTVSVNELVITSSEYLDRVFSQCSILCPKLATSKSVRKWLDDLTLPAFNGFQKKNE